MMLFEYHGYLLLEKYRKIYKTLKNIEKPTIRLAKAKTMKRCTILFLFIDHLHNEEQSYLALLMVKCELSPSSLQ